jgi:phosphoribosylformylglycinamidine cyclo-ligase
MYEVYNMGHRFEIYVKPDIAKYIIKISKELGVDAQIVGRTEAFEGQRITISTPQGEFIY